MNPFKAAIQSAVVAYARAIRGTGHRRHPAVMLAEVASARHSLLKAIGHGATVGNLDDAYGFAAAALRAAGVRSGLPVEV